MISTAPSENDRALYPLKDTAHIIGIGLTKTYELLNSGDLETVRIGRRRLVTADSIKRLIERLRGEAA